MKHCLNGIILVQQSVHRSGEKLFRHLPSIIIKANFAQMKLLKKHVNGIDLCIFF